MVGQLDQQYDGESDTVQKTKPFRGVGLMKMVAPRLVDDVKGSGYHEEGETDEYPNIQGEHIDEGGVVQRCSVPQRLPECKGDPGENWYCVVYHLVPIQVECQRGQDDVGLISEAGFDRRKLACCLA